MLQTTKQLHHAERLAVLGELTAGIAHEVRNPISGIRGAAEIVGRADVAPEVRAEFAAILLKETTRLNQVVENILSFARLHQEQLEDADLAEVVRRAVALVGKEAERRGVVIVQDVPPDIRLHTDPPLLQQVLLNLLLNAIQAMPGGGTVTVAAKTVDGRLALSVGDTGPGIAPELHESVFTPFFTTKADGTGLGLAIARRIARGMRGDIRLRSTPGAGAEFTLDVPLRLGAAAGADLFSEGDETAEDGVDGVDKVDVQR